jgi:hypothetical protein
MMIRFSLILALFIAESFEAFMSFKKEQRKMMIEYNNWIPKILNNARCITLLGYKYPVENILNLDPIALFREMRKVVDEVFILIFWITFRDPWDFIVIRRIVGRTRGEIIDKISISNCPCTAAFNMLYHFKVHLMNCLATYRGDKSAMLIEAWDFYTFRLKTLLLQVLSADQDSREFALIGQMDQNFRFYHLCIEKDNIKSLFIREFLNFKFSLKSNNKEQIEIHTENMTFLAGILMYDRSTIFGLNLISDQSPQLIGNFLIMQYRQSNILRGLTLSECYCPPIWQISYLHEKIPIFEYPDLFCPNPTLKFIPLMEFNNDYEDILGRNELIDLVRTLYEKILLF